MALIQMGILVIFASVAFAGNVFLFFLWAAGVLALFSAWLFSLPVSPIGKVYALTNFTTFLIFALYFNWEIDRRARGVFAANRALVAERRQTEELLYNVLPRKVAARLTEGQPGADAFSDPTVTSVDTAASSNPPP